MLEVYEDYAMVLKTKIRVSQSKKAWTQYVTIPSAVVQDSQYPFKADEELNLEIEPTLGIMIISREGIPLKATPNGVLVIKAMDLEAEFKSRQNPLEKN